MSSTSSPSIGIDLGTTYSCVGTFRDGKVEIIPNDQGNRTTPSYVAFTDEILIGEAAKSQLSKNINNTYFDIKRIIGCKFDNKDVQKEIKHFPFKVYDENNHPRVKPMFKGVEKSMSPEEISAQILGKMKSISESFLGCTVKNAVITVPAYFSDEQRSATRDAGIIAGLNVLRVINEPTAAALAYGLQKSSKDGKDRNILVFDLGGGTFDVSILTTSDEYFEVQSTSGDTHLGGEDFDNIMVNYFLEDFASKHKKTLLRTNEKDSKAICRLKAKCEDAKKMLSSAKSTTVDIDSFYEGIDYSVTITRAKFEELCKDLFKSCLVPVESALTKAKMGKSEIDDIVLVGGSTRIPKIRDLLEQFFNGKKAKTDINPDEAVAYGATVMAAMLSGDKSENIKDIVMVDVAPLNIGVKVEGDIVEPIIKSGTQIPTTFTKTFTTARDNQEQVDIEIYEGIGRPAVRDNTLLGKFEMSGIPKMKRGEHKISITLKITESGVLDVLAEVESTNIKNQITVTNRSRLSNEEIERMKQDAEKFKKDDDEYREVVTVKSEFERLIDFSSEQLESDTMKNLPEEKLKDLKATVEESKMWLMTNPHPTLQECKDKFETAQKQLSEFMQDVKNDMDPSKMQEMMKNFTPEQMEELSKKMSGMRSDKKDSTSSDDDDDVTLDETSVTNQPCVPSIEEVD